MFSYFDDISKGIYSVVHGKLEKPKQMLNWNIILNLTTTNFNEFINNWIKQDEIYKRFNKN